MAPKVLTPEGDVVPSALDGLVVRHRIEDLDNPIIDDRGGTPPLPEELEEGLREQLTDVLYIHHHHHHHHHHGHSNSLSSTRSRSNSNGRRVRHQHIEGYHTAEAGSSNEVSHTATVVQFDLDSGNNSTVALPVLPRHGPARYGGGNGEKDEYKKDDIGTGTGAVPTLNDNADLDPNATKYIEFEPNDPRNPITYSRRKKWSITIAGAFFTVIVSAAAGAYNMGFETMIPDLGCTQLQATGGLSLYAAGFGVVPLFSSSFSEEFGRQPLYICSIIGFMLVQIGMGFVTDIHTMLALRIILGGFGSTGSTMVSGTISDIWEPHERALPMSLFGISALAGTGLGPFVAGWIVSNHRLDWRWIQWISAMISFVSLVSIIVFMRETRSPVLLTKLAKKIRKETGDNRYRARVEDEGIELKRLIWISCTRPMLLLTTEPTVTAFSIWIGFTWGLVYVLLESVSLVFTDLHNFKSGGVGSVFATMVIGALLGFISNFYQNHLYLKNYKTRGVEGRLYTCMAAGILLPLAMLMYGLSCISTVHWIVPVVALTLFMMGATIVYIGTFIYLSDCYGPFASSAVAGSSLVRNIAGTAFPLFTTQMFNALTFRWANLLFAGVALLLMPVPFILFKFGPRIRTRSKISRMVMETQQQKEQQAQEVELKMSPGGSRSQIASLANKEEGRLDRV